VAEIPKIVLELIARFEQNIDAYRSQAYNETQVRQEFINPLFEALGWDVSNRSGHAEAYKDIIHEDAIKVGGSTKAPDYSFRIGGVRKFFLEAKKPSVTIKDDTSPAYQLRRYAWSAKLPLSILTNFAEFAVYDCRVAPKAVDKASVGRVLYFTYNEYESRWEEIAKVFSKEAILQGSFDKFAETGKGKRGTSPVDAQFLAEIESWREALAKNLALRNPRLSVRDLNFAVQRTIDRIIFLRMCEDRGIEHYAQLQGLLNGENIYKRLQYVYSIADDKYNSGLFHFREEKDRAETPDELTLTLKIDDKVLKDIIGRLYYPESPYEFSVLGGDILGNVYEQFLGKVIRLTAGHHAVIEEKPEVKKAGGVYYTPAYIVDYIVKNTVGKLCEGKSPRQIEKFRILDPACGSGSFLIGAYTYLLNHHRDWYVNDGPQKHTKVIYQGAGGHWYLTTQEKKRILLNNIYGVDIDSQAVEVTKLSLLLKVLEGESEETIGKTLKLFRERALPDLGNNIKCGNSLIGPDFHKNKQMSLLGDEDRYRINVFDWGLEFPVIMKSGGFDAVIGNPPYVRIQALQEWAPIEVEHYKTAYKSAGKGNYDLYVVFVEKGLSLLNKNGRLGFILPHKFFNAQYGEPLRGLVAKGKHLAEVIHFGDQQIFAGATTYTCLLFLDKAGSSQCRVVKVEDLTTWRGNGEAFEGFVPATRITASEWNFTVGKGADLFEKLRNMPLKLGDLTHLFVGLQTDADDVFILEEVRRDKDRVLCESASTGKQHWFEQDHLKPFLKGSLNIRRYYLSDVTKRLIFPYDVKDGKAPLIDEKGYRRRYPLTWHYLEQNRERLSSRNKGRMGKEWYGYVYKKNHTLFGAPKLLVPAIATGSCFAADLEGKYYFVGSGGGGGGGYGITLRESTKFSYAYLLGLLNSKLLSGYLKGTSTPFRGGFIALNRQYIEQLPIRGIDFSDPAEKARHDKMVILVERMLDLQKKLAAAKNPNDKTNLQREIEATDRQIDQLVYELYGLTAEEIKIVEEV
jgi:type I restriction-modification system DNA methylase subunit